MNPQSRKPRLLDLFAGAGGSAMGYHRAGFEVVGVDITAQPHYPFRVIEHEDAISVLEWLTTDPGWRTIDADGEFLTLTDFAAIHASPPCPVHSSLNGWSGETTSPNFIPETRELLRATGLPYVIENVVGAPLESPVKLCGASFGLGVEIDGKWRELRRHRLFETNFPLMASPCYHTGPPVIVVGGSIGRKVFDPRRKAIAPTFEQAREAMGMPWAKTRQEVVNAIPPAYTEHVAGFLLTHLKAESLAA